MAVDVFLRVRVRVRVQLVHVRLALCMCGIACTCACVQLLQALSTACSTVAKFLFKLVIRLSFIRSRTVLFSFPNTVNAKLIFEICYYV